jgi:hypothetical protein
MELENDMVQKKKKLEKYKKAVQKRYPGAYALLLNGGYYTIVQDQEDLSFKDILQEQYFNPVKSIDEAWLIASTAAKTTQNLNRTHPIRIEGMKLEDKIARVESRRIKTYSNKEQRKFREIDNY